MGRRVFILGEADRLIAQEASQEAANALLKLLEEPPVGSLFLLTTVEPRRLLPTMRSTGGAHQAGTADGRRGGRVPEGALEAGAFARGAGAAGGCWPRVRSARRSAAGDEAGKAQQAAQRWLEAVLAGPGPAFERALKQATLGGAG